MVIKENREKKRGWATIRSTAGGPADSTVNVSMTGTDEGGTLSPRSELTTYHDRSLDVFTLNFGDEVRARRVEAVPVRRRVPGHVERFGGLTKLATAAEVGDDRGQSEGTNDADEGQEGDRSSLD